MICTISSSGRNVADTTASSSIERWPQFKLNETLAKHLFQTKANILTSCFLTEKQSTLLVEVVRFDLKVSYCFLIL